MEVVARQLLLLWLSLTAPDSMSMHEKTEVFLEVFGNTEIRCQTEETVKHVAALLLLSVTNTIDTHTQSHPCLDTSLLKFKERDELIQIFAQWQQPPSATANMAKAWDARVRRHLGTRYDSRLGSYDWDLTMKLHQKGCGVIHKQQYAKWRERGLAFEMREGLYQIANQSLLSTRVFNHRGDRVGLRGYWGDIVSSPYLAFGIETENKELLKTQNNQHVKSAQEISVANIQMLFESLAIRGGHPHKHHLGGKGVDLATGVETEPFQKNQDTMDNQMTKEETQTIKQACGIHAEVKEQPETPYKAKDLELMNLNGVRVSFLSLDSLSKLPTKGQFSQRFNSLYCSASMVHHLDSSLKQVAAPGALLMIELTKYLLDLSKEQEAAFTARVGEIAKDLGFISARDSSDNSYAVFTLQDD